MFFIYAIVSCLVHHFVIIDMLYAKEIMKYEKIWMLRLNKKIVDKKLNKMREF